MAVLIIGATGYVGELVYQNLKKQEIREECIGTKFHTINSELIKFDITKDDIAGIDSMIKDTEKFALICSADSNIEYCLENKEKAYAKNVLATKRVIQELKNLNYHITFLSSDNVFDGEKGNYIESDNTNPVNEYGKMKEEVEQYLVKYVPNSCIMRIGKVVGNFQRSNDLLREWYNKAQNNEGIFCIKGNILTITYINDIVNSYSLIVQKKLTGIYHIVVGESKTRKELCQEFFEYLGIDKEIIEKDITKFPFNERRPLDISMSNEKFKKTSGYQFVELSQIWKEFKENIVLKNI